MRREMSFILALAFAVPGTAGAFGCDLSGKQIIYRTDRCAHGSCQTGGELLQILGKKVLRHHSDTGGMVYYLGRTIRAEDDPLQDQTGKFAPANSARDTQLTATLVDDTLTLIKASAIGRGNAPGHIIDMQKIKVRPDCTFCDVLEDTMMGTLADGTQVGRIVASGSSCNVSDIPPN